VGGAWRMQLGGRCTGGQISRYLSYIISSPLPSTFSHLHQTCTSLTTHILAHFQPDCPVHSSLHQTRACLTTHNLAPSQSNPLRPPTLHPLNLETLHAPFIPHAPPLRPPPHMHYQHALIREIQRLPQGQKHRKPADHVAALAVHC